MARRSQCSSAGDNPNHPNYLPPHYREEYRLAIDALVEDDLEGYYQLLQKADVVDFLCTPEIQHIQSSIHLPRQSNHPEQHFLEIGEDGSSDTYWPLHSDLEAPGLDLGWPQMHHFLGPTEVTTLVNPPEPDMPSIKDQARRLIKNAQQVIAIAMDMFTDVDMFFDILNAAMRNVAVYIILDEQNAHYFVDMVSNCRVNLQSIQQFLRVRTVPGITYQCRSGKSFKGQMMDRFLLTDCRAVLSGNYSFMWSYEKLHRCMAHLFLGQLVTTFDEEFRILYAQSQPLIVEMPGPMEGLGHPQQRQYPSERKPLYREPKKFLDAGPPDEWIRPAYDEPDWRMMPLKKDQVRGPADLYNRFPSQQLRMDPSFDQGSSRTPMMENPAFKRHSYAEGVPGRYNTQFLQQQGMPDSEAKHFVKGPQPHPGPGREGDYSAYDKFWNQDYLSTDLYPEHGPPLDNLASGDFDPVLNYLSSAEPADSDQVSDKLLGADLTFGSPHLRRQTLGQPYACQTSPTPSNPSEQKRFLQDLTSDRKDPAVKRGLRNWRISSYLSACDNPGDEGLPLAPPQSSDPFEEPTNPIQQPAPRVDVSLPKIPNVREFKVPAVPRACHMPSYIKAMTKEQPKQVVEEPAAMTDTKTPSDSSSTTEGEKVEEVSALRREDSFRRKYNAAQPRSSRLRSSLIFSSLDQQNTLDTKSDQQGEESDKNEPEQTKMPILSHLLGQRRSSAREPIKWSRFMKSATFDQSSTETSTPGEGDSDTGKKDSKLPEQEHSKECPQNPKPQESLKHSDTEKTKGREAALPLDPPLSCVDMSDPDNRLMYFKQLAAKRKAAKAAEAKKNKEKSSLEQSADVKKEEPVDEKSRGNKTSTSERSLEKSVAAESVLEVVSTLKENPVPEDSSENMASEAKALLEKHATAESDLKAMSAEAHKSDCPSSNATEPTVNRDNCDKNAGSDATSSVKAEQSKVVSDSQISKPGNSSAGVLPEKESSHLKSKSNSRGKDNKSDLSSATTDSPRVTTLAEGTDQIEDRSFDPTSKVCHSVETSSVGELQSPVLDSNPPDKSVNSSPLLAKPDTVSQVSSSKPSVDTPPDEDSSKVSNQKESGSPNATPKVSVSTPAYSIFLSNVPTKTTEESASSLSEESAQSAVKNSRESETLTPDAPLDSSLPVTVSEKSAVLDSAQAISPDVPLASEPDRCSSQSTAGPEPQEVSSNATSPKGTQKQIHHAKEEVCKSETAIPEVNKVDSDLNKNISAPGRGESKSDQDVSGSDNVDSVPDEVASVSNKESEKDERLSGSSVPQTEGVSESEEVASHFGKDASDSGISSPPHPVADESESRSSSIKTGDVSSGVRSSVPDSSSLPMPSPVSKPDLKETVTLASTPGLTPADNVSSEQTSSAQTDGAVNISQAKTTESPLDAANQATQPSDLNAESDLSSEVKTAEPNTPALKSVCHASETPTDSAKAPQPPSANSPSGPTEPTFTEATEVNPPSARESEASESHASKPTVTSGMATDEQKSSDAKTSNTIHEDDQVKKMTPPDQAEVTVKQPKSTQSRYHSSTANVLSSSNLRDDTKLLLEQISANSQTRSDTPKEPPVTDDEKEDEADKIAKIQKERGIRSLDKGQDKSAPEREKLLERFQSIRKERKVYSRFEV